MEKYCCEKFKARHQLDRTMGLNIRVIKLLEKDVYSRKDLKSPYRFFITEGFEKGQKNVKRSLISYCPFCGKKLSKYFKSDYIVNEEYGNFMSY